MRVLVIAAAAATVIGAGAFVAVAQDKEAPAAAAPAKKPYPFPADGAVPVVDEKAIAELIANHGSDYLVVNMWATWCGPCVEELPYFVKVAREIDPAKVRMVGLSADMADEAESKVKPFLAKMGVPYPNLVMDVSDMDAFITSVSKRWTGGLPATFVFDREGKLVAEKLTAVTEAELRAFLDGTIPGGLKGAAKAPAGS